MAGTACPLGNQCQRNTTACLQPDVQVHADSQSESDSITAAGDERTKVELWSAARCGSAYQRFYFV